jgi:ABC-2 type transport system permease protein
LNKEIKAVYTIWLREMTKFFRERTSIASSMMTPILWLFVFGGGMGINIRMGTTGVGYSAFIFPGIIGMTLLFTSIRSGISIMWDRDFGFLKEIMVAPISRISIVLGKAMGGATTAVLEGLIILLLSFVVGIHISMIQVFLLLPVMLLISLGYNGFGLTFASLMESSEGFQGIMSFIIMPTFFLSGALWPLTNAPQWLQVVSLCNPLTYGVDTMRHIILNEGQFSLPVDVIIMIGFAIAMITFSSRLFSVKK